MRAQIDREKTELTVRYVRIYHSIGCLVIIMIAGPLHFAYEWSGENFLVSLVAPVNESIWEHLKMIYWPTLLWWCIGYIIFRNRKKLSGIRWFQSMAVSIISSMMFIVLWYYTWSGAFGIEASWVNYSSMIGIFVGQLLAMHVYRVVRPRWIYFIPGVLIVLGLAFMSVYFTYYPPALPMFVSPY